MSNDLPNDQITKPINVPLSSSTGSDDTTSDSLAIPDTLNLKTSSPNFSTSVNGSFPLTDDLQSPSSSLPTPAVTPTSKGFTGGGKESERIDLGLMEQKIEMEELGKEMEISKELERMGVEKTPTEFPVPKEIKNYVEPLASPATPIREEPKVVNIPLNDEQISIGVRQKVTQSIRWLAEFCLKQLKKTHIKIKFIKGKLVRMTTT